MSGVVPRPAHQLEAWLTGNLRAPRRPARFQSPQPGGGGVFARSAYAVGRAFQIRRDPHGHGEARRAVVFPLLAQRDQSIASGFVHLRRNFGRVLCGLWAVSGRGVRRTLQLSPAPLPDRHVCQGRIGGCDGFTGAGDDFALRSAAEPIAGHVARQPRRAEIHGGIPRGDESGNGARALQTGAGRAAHLAGHPAADLRQ